MPVVERTDTSTTTTQPSLETSSDDAFELLWEWVALDLPLAVSPGELRMRWASLFKSHLAITSSALSMINQASLLLSTAHYGSALHESHIERLRAGLRGLNTTTEPLVEVSFEPAFHKLDRLSQLTKDWDSYGAETISGIALAEARKLLALVRDVLTRFVGERAQPYAIAPLASGGVQLEWRGPRGDIEVEINPDGTLGYLYVWEKGEELEIDQERDTSVSVILTKLSHVLSG